MQNISIYNTHSRTTDTKRGDSDACIQALVNLGYRVDHLHEHNMFVVFKDGEVEYIITVF